MREAVRAAGVFLRWILLLVVFVVAYALIFPSPAPARWKAEYAAASADTRAWYENAILTPAARKRFGFWGCCKYSDVVKAQFKVERADGKDAWYWLHGAAWERIPDDIIHWDEQAPDNKPTLFALAEPWGAWPAGTLTCFYPPGGAS